MGKGKIWLSILRKEIKLYNYISKSFVYFPKSNNTLYYNNFDRMMYAIISIVGAMVTLITFGFIVTTWPTDYMSYLIKKRCSQNNV